MKALVSFSSLGITAAMEMAMTMPKLGEEAELASVPVSPMAMERMKVRMPVPPYVLSRIDIWNEYSK